MLQSVSIIYPASAKIHSLRMAYHEWGFPHIILNDVNQLPLDCQPWVHSPWFFSLSNDRAAGMNISIKSGTLRMMRTAQSAACNNNVLCEMWTKLNITPPTQVHWQRHVEDRQMLSSNDWRWAMYTCERLQQSWPSAWDTRHHITDSQSPVTHSCSCHA